MIDQINELPEDGLKSSPETSRYTENKWIGRKNQNELYFLHVIDKLNFDYLKNKKISQSEIRNNFSCFTSALFWKYKTSQPKCSGHNLSVSLYNILNINSKPHRRMLSKKIELLINFRINK